MTVKELIEELKKYDEDKEVIARGRFEFDIQEVIAHEDRIVIQVWYK